MTDGASILVAGDLPPSEALGTTVLAWLAIVALSRTTDPLVLGLLGRLWKEMLGVDVMQRARWSDLWGQRLGRSTGPRGKGTG